MIKIFSPRDEAELTVAKSMLESEGIPYHVKNEHFGSLYPGISIKYINAKTIYVPPEYKEDVIALLGNFIDEEDIEEINSFDEIKGGNSEQETMPGILQKFLEYIKKAGK